ncbi:MAG: hypothetical protein Q6363_010430 [Candidatus Njordarchaeota archaeon]
MGNKGPYLILGFILLVIPVANAGLFNSGDITFSVDQKDYYFMVGEDAIIPLHIENTYGKEINGILSYSYTQEINRGGMYMSYSNSQSTTFSVKKGKTTQGLNFGTSDNPATLDIDLKFVYTEKEPRVVNLEGIRIHFVSDESQKQNQPGGKSASSEKYSPPQQSSQQNPFSQMQKQIDEMMRRSQQPQNPQQALQNNQMTQDSSALKKEIENQIKKQQEMKREFREKLFQNPELQKEHQELLNQGYNLTDADFNPLSNDTGSFELRYQNLNGGKASLSGEMNNGKIENLKKDTPEMRRELLNKLQQNKQFQEYQKQLQKGGYSRQNTEISYKKEKTIIKVNYANRENETATIKAEAVNNTIKNVELERAEKQKKDYWWILLVLLVLLLLAALGYFAYKRFSKKSKPEREVKKKSEKPFDYRSESIRLIEKSKSLFEQKRYKDAYGTAAQGLRLFLSYENRLNKETTNDEIINFLREHKKEYKEAKECFDLCSLVEFARYKANKEDFDRIIRKARGIIDRESK